MPTLSGFDGRSLVPDVGARLGRGIQLGGELQRQKLLGQQAQQQQAAAEQAAAQEARRRQLLGLPPLGGQPVATPGFVPGQPVPQLGAQPPQQPPQLGPQTVQPQAQPQPPINLDQLAIEFPALAQQIANARKSQFDNISAREKQKVESVVIGAAQALASPSPLAFLKNRAQELADPTETNEVIAAFESGDVAGGTAMLKAMVSLGNQLGILKQPKTDVLSPEALAQKQAIAAAGGTRVSVGANGQPLSVDEQIELASRTKLAEKLAETRGKGIAAREAADIASGSEAARTIPNLQRSIDLLKEIPTGGFNAVELKAKQFLGVETADEAELVNAMSKQVIAQLKPVFGSQFTKAEGDWLKAIEASSGKSTEGNVRLMERGLVLAKKRANTGLKASIAAKDFRSAQEIQDFIDLDLTPDSDELTNKSDDELLRF